MGADPGDDVTYLLAANPGSPPLPLARVASGGELARTMLALRLVLSEAPPTLVFDEVDAGIGGDGGHAVGRALAALAADHQVLVVTHLPQVAAFADAPGRGHQARAWAGHRDRRPRLLDGEDRVGRAGPHAVGLARQRHGPPPRRRAAGRVRREAIERHP